MDDDAGTVLAAKAPSTPPDYSRGVIDVLEALAEQLGCPIEEMLANTHHIAHGTTSSLNALVTGNVPPVGFLTTKGHRDSIYIMNVEGRYLGGSPEQLQNVMGQSKSHGLVPKKHALEVTERLDRDATSSSHSTKNPPVEPSARFSPTASPRSRSHCCGRSATPRTNSAFANSSTRSTRRCSCPCRVR